MAEGAKYDDVKFSAERQEDQGVFTFYAHLGDIKVPFGAVKTGTVDELTERHAEEQARQQSSQQTDQTS